MAMRQRGNALMTEGRHKQDGLVARLAAEMIGLALPAATLPGVSEAWRALGDHAQRLLAARDQGGAAD